MERFVLICKGSLSYGRYGELFRVMVLFVALRQAR